MAVFNNFLVKLSERLRKENHLSDITWAVAEACPEFQLFFLQFFFEEISDPVTITGFKREYSQGDCRPDFYIQAGEQEYLIECKIYDGCHHFEQYRNGFPRARIGYITNYPLLPVEGFQIRTWREFKAFLTRKLDSVPIHSASLDLIQGYLHYLTNVCSLYETIKVENLNHLTSLASFNGIVQKVVTSLPGYETSIYYSAKSCDQNRSGHYFSLRKANSTTTIWPWLGVYYLHNRVVIYFELNQKWCSPVYNAFPQAHSFQQGTYYKLPYLNEDYGGAVCFELKEDLFNALSQLPTVEEQEKLLSAFVGEILVSVDSYL